MTNNTITVPGPIWLRVTRRGRKGSLGVGTYKGTVHVVEEHDGVPVATCTVIDPHTGRESTAWVHVSCLSPR